MPIDHLVLVAAIRRAGLNRARIGDALRCLSPWDGATGPVVWDNLGGNTRPAHLAVASQGRLLRIDRAATERRGKRRLNGRPELRPLVEDDADGHAYLNAAGNLHYQDAGVALHGSVVPISFFRGEKAFAFRSTPICREK